MKDKLQQKIKEQGYAIVLVYEVLYSVLHDDLYETGFTCIDKECNEFTFSYDDIGRVE